MEVEIPLDTKTISRRAINGAFSLTLRRIALQAISFVTINFVLARILPVTILGIFNIGTAIISFFSFFSDIGLAAALIQKKESLTLDDLRTTFTIQQLLALTLLILIWFSAPILAQFYGLDLNGVWLLRSLGLSFFLTSLKVIPSVVLERHLRFNPLVTVEILETLVFNLGLITLVKADFGITAFSWATIFRSIVGVIVIYIISPWKLGFALNLDSARELLNFGIPYQVNSLLALLKDRLVPLIIAKMVGALGIGYISWAQNLAFLPLEVMNIIIRVTFPTLSRLQEDKQNLKIALERSLFATCLFLYPALFGMAALAPSLVTHVVSTKWIPSLPLFYLFSVSTFWATLSTTFTNTLNAIGEIKVTLKLMIFWTVLTWVLTPILTLFFGFLGVAISSALISFTSLLTIVLIKRRIEVSIFENIWPTVLASALMGIVVFYIASKLVYNLPTLLLMVVLGVLIYMLLIWLLAKYKLKTYIKEFRNAISNR